jgi:DNA-binding response OmpR family regulator
MSYKLIIADASPSIQKSVQLAFSAPDWEIVPYDNGSELTRTIFDVHPDGLLVSLTLPGLDGYGVGRFLRKQEEFRDTALVFLKGSFETLDAEKVAGIEYDDVVQKPFDSNKLAVRMKNLIDARGEHLGFPESPIPAEAAQSQTAADVPAETPPAAPTGDLEKRLQDWLKRELVEVEREVEKRVRTQIVADLKKWLAERASGPPSPRK